MYGKLLAVSRNQSISRVLLKAWHFLVIVSLALWVGRGAMAQHNHKGSVFGWGYNYYGDLGNGSVTTDPPYGVFTPVQVVGPGGVGGLSSVSAVAAGAAHTVALKSDGTVLACGWNLAGQIW